MDGSGSRRAWKQRANRICQRSATRGASRLSRFGHSQTGSTYLLWVRGYGYRLGFTGPSKIHAIDFAFGLLNCLACIAMSRDAARVGARATSRALFHNPSVVDRPRGTPGGLGFEALSACCAWRLAGSMRMVG